MQQKQTPTLTMSLENTKPQDPRSMETPSSKHQLRIDAVAQCRNSSNQEPDAAAAATLFGAWGFGTSLDLGPWCLDLPASPVHGRVVPSLGCMEKDGRFPLATGRGSVGESLFNRLDERRDILVQAVQLADDFTPGVEQGEDV